MRSTTFCGAAAPIPTVRDILKRQENNVALNEVMFPLPRVFAACDAVIDSDLHRLTNAGALSKSLMKVMSKNVKRFSLSMEKWVEVRRCDHAHRAALTASSPLVETIKTIILLPVSHLPAP